MIQRRSVERPADHIVIIRGYGYTRSKVRLAMNVGRGVAAGFTTVGNLMFVPTEERPRRSDDLVDAGVVAITDSWRALADALLPWAPLSGLTRGESVQPNRIADAVDVSHEAE